MKSDYTPLKRACGLLPSLAIAIALCSASYAQAEVYRWVDEKGKVHYGDKMHARKNKVDIKSEFINLDPTGNTMTLYAIADAHLDERAGKIYGTGDKFSTKQLRRRGIPLSTRAIVKFDTSELLRHYALHKPQLAFASLSLSLAETEEEKKRSTIKSNAFYVLPTHNNWNEENTTWDDFYNKNTKPYAIRKLPSMTAPSSTSLNSDTYKLNALPLIKEVIENNMRELSLEIQFQKVSANSDITFYSKEHSKETSPKLVIEFMDKASK